MANVTIELTGRFDAAFGFLARNIVPRSVAINPYQMQTFDEGDSEFENVTLEYQREGADTTTLNFSSFPFVRGGSNGALESIVAPPPLIEFSRDKVQVTTPINNSGDEVLEHWNTQQYNIRMRGILVDMDNHTRPSDLVTMIHRLFEYNGVIDATGTQFFELEIAYIYLKNVQINSVVGYPDTVQYTLQAKATREVGFTLLNPNG